MGSAPVRCPRSARPPYADVYLQDEVQIAFHPTLTRVWCRKGRRGQRLVEAPGDNSKAYGFGLVDWRDGWFDGRVGPRRTADLFRDQLRAAWERSRKRGRVAIVIADNLRTHTPRGSLLVRELLAEAGDQLRIVYTPAYDPDANRIEPRPSYNRDSAQQPQEPRQYHGGTPQPSLGRDHPASGPALPPQRSAPVGDRVAGWRPAVCPSLLVHAGGRGGREQEHVGHPQGRVTATRARRPRLEFERAA